MDAEEGCLTALFAVVGIALFVVIAWVIAIVVLTLLALVAKGLIFTLVYAASGVVAGLLCALGFYIIQTLRAEGESAPPSAPHIMAAVSAVSWASFAGHAWALSDYKRRVLDAVGPRLHRWMDVVLFPAEGDFGGALWGNGGLVFALTVPVVGFYAWRAVQDKRARLARDLQREAEAEQLRAQEEDRKAREAHQNVHELGSVVERLDSMISDVRGRVTRADRQRGRIGDHIAKLEAKANPDAAKIQQAYGELETCERIGRSCERVLERLELFRFRVASRRHVLRTLRALPEQPDMSALQQDASRPDVWIAHLESAKQAAAQACAHISERRSAFEAAHAKDGSETIMGETLGQYDRLWSSYDDRVDSIEALLISAQNRAMADMGSLDLSASGWVADDLMSDEVEAAVRSNGEAVLTADAFAQAEGLLDFSGDLGALEQAEMELASQDEALRELRALLGQPSGAEVECVVEVGVRSDAL